MYFSFETTDEHIVAIYKPTVTATENPLDCITEDLVLYAAFTETIRTYTARFYVDDELVSEQEVAYGETATAPELTKDGYVLEWVPSDMTITGDTDFIGVWTKDYIVSEQTLSFKSSSNYGCYCSYNSAGANKTLTIGDTYIVEWDGKAYSCIAQNVQYTVDNQYISNVTLNGAIGNAKILTKFYGYAASATVADSGEPFLLHINKTELTIYTNETDATHTVAIYKA